MEKKTKQDSCKRCGSCCKGEGTLFLKKSEFDKYERFHKFPNRGVPGAKDYKETVAVMFSIFDQCPYLKSNNLCEIQKDKPEVCETKYCFYVTLTTPIENMRTAFRSVLGLEEKIN